MWIVLLLVMNLVVVVFRIYLASLGVPLVPRLKIRKANARLERAFFCRSKSLTDASIRRLLKRQKPILSDELFVL